MKLLIFLLMLPAVVAAQEGKVLAKVGKDFSRGAKSLYRGDYEKSLAYFNAMTANLEFLSPEEKEEGFPALEAFKFYTLALMENNSGKSIIHINKGLEICREYRWSEFYASEAYKIHIDLLLFKIELSEKIYLQHLLVKEAYEIASENISTEKDHRFLEILSWYGFIRESQRQPKDAIVYYRSILDIIGSNKKVHKTYAVDYLDAIYDVALLLSTEGEPEEALNLLKKADDQLNRFRYLNDEYDTTRIHNYAYAYLQMREFQKALSYLTPLLNDNDFLDPKPEKRATYMMAAFAYELSGEISLSEKYYTISNTLFATNDSGQLNLSQSLQNLGKFYMRNNQPGKAFQSFSKSFYNYERFMKTEFALLNEAEQEEFLLSNNQFFYTICELANKYHNVQPEAVELVLNNSIYYKGLIFDYKREFRKKIYTSGDRDLKRELAVMNSLKEDIANKYRKGSSTSSAGLYESLYETESRLLNKFNDEIPKVDLISWQQLQKALKPGEAIIDIVYFEQKENELTGNTVIPFYGIILLKHRGRPQWITSFTEKELLNALEGAEVTQKLALRSIEMETVVSDLQKLQDLIWEPISVYLAEERQLFICPAGLAQLMPFSALRSKEDSFLIHKYLFTNLTSTKALISDFANINTDTSLFVFMGGANYNSLPGVSKTSGKPWQYLEGTKVEVNEISSIVSSKNTFCKVFTDEEFNESTVKLQSSIYYSSKTTTNGEITGEKRKKASVLHIATHGFYYSSTGKGNYFTESEDPMIRSGLVCSGANFAWNADTAIVKGLKDDGVLTALEISTLDLEGTKLVVLSACETAKGDSRGHEGVYGLQRAFKIAGADYLLVSLWEIPDLATVELMKSFYLNLSATSDIEIAFKLAQVEMSEKYHPYAWAGFILLK